jgi:hypothetical protein
MSILYLCIVKPDGNFSCEYPSGQKAIKDYIKNKIRPTLAPQDYKDKHVEGRFEVFLHLFFLRFVLFVVLKLKSSI